MTTINSREFTSLGGIFTMLTECNFRCHVSKKNEKILSSTQPIFDAYSLSFLSFSLAHMCTSAPFFAGPRRPRQERRRTRQRAKAAVSAASRERAVGARQQLDSPAGDEGMRGGLSKNLLPTLCNAFFVSVRFLRGLVLSSLSVFVACLVRLYGTAFAVSQ